MTFPSEIVDLDCLLGGSSLNSVPSPAETPPSNAAPQTAVEETPEETANSNPRPNDWAIQLIQDELFAKARYLNWSEAELKQIYQRNDAQSICALRDRISRELRQQFQMTALSETAISSTYPQLSYEYYC